RSNSASPKSSDNAWLAAACRNKSSSACRLAMICSSALPVSAGPADLIVFDFVILSEAKNLAVSFDSQLCAPGTTRLQPDAPRGHQTWHRIAASAATLATLRELPPSLPRPLPRLLG